MSSTFRDATCMVKRSISAACRASMSGGAPAHDRLSARIASTRSSNASHLHQPYFGLRFTCGMTSLQSKVLAGMQRCMSMLGGANRGEVCVLLLLVSAANASHKVGDVRAKK